MSSFNSITFQDKLQQTGVIGFETASFYNTKTLPCGEMRSIPLKITSKFTKKNDSNNIEVDHHAPLKISLNNRVINLNPEKSDIKKGGESHYCITRDQDNQQYGILFQLNNSDRRIQQNFIKMVDVGNKLESLGYKAGKALGVTEYQDTSFFLGNQYAEKDENELAKGIIVQHIPGKDLSTIYKNENIPLKSCFEIGSIIASGSEDMYNNNKLEHRDIKPNNFILTDNAIEKIRGNKGINKDDVYFIDLTSFSSKKDNKETVGTVSYMAAWEASNIKRKMHGLHESSFVAEIHPDVLANKRMAVLAVATVSAMIMGRDPLRGHFTEKPSTCHELLHQRSNPDHKLDFELMEQKGTPKEFIQLCKRSWSKNPHDAPTLNEIQSVFKDLAK